MTAQARETLSGLWSGSYSYPSPLEAPVAFSALLSEEDGAFNGECVEPNTFSPDKLHELFSTFEGRRDGVTIRFKKFYEPATYAGHTVSYEGESNAELTRIDGVWRVEGVLGPWTGAFVMTRIEEDEQAKAAEAEQKA